MQKSYTDKEIIKGCRANNSEYQRALVMQYSELLFATSLRYLKDEDAAKDVLQDSLMRIFKSMHSFDINKGKLTSWMCKIVINESLKRWKKEQVNVSYSDYFEGATEKPLAIQNLSVEEIHSIIRNLEDPYRTVFNLHVIEGYKHKEIAEVLSIETASSRSILSRAKEMIRNTLISIKQKESWV